MASVRFSMSSGRQLDGTLDVVALDGVLDKRRRQAAALAAGSPIDPGVAEEVGVAATGFAGGVAEGQAFADQSGVHRAYMGGIERGERNLTLRSLERMAERVGIEPLKLLGQVPERTSDDSRG